jgi:hypothetical protein
MKYRTVHFIVLWLLSSLPLLWADQLIPLSLSELTGQAELIVLGTVLSKTSQQDEAGRIFTRIECQISEVWKGAVSSQILTVVHGGGILGSRGVAVSGQVDYAVGEEVVAFLVRNVRSEAVTLGLAQGKFHVAQDPQTSVKTVHNLFHGTPSAFSSAAAKATTGAAASLTLLQLKQAVQESRQLAPTGKAGGSSR